MKLQNRLAILYGFTLACASSPSSNSSTETSEATTSEADSGAGEAEATSGADLPPDDSTTDSETSSETDTDNDTGGDTCAPENGCDAQAQDCPPDHKCMPIACESGQTSDLDSYCVPIMGDGVAGDPCESLGSGYDGLDTCAEGFHCQYVDLNTGFGTCEEICDSAFGCPEGWYCGGDALDSVPTCLSACHPLDLETCPPGFACQPAGPGFGCYEAPADGEGEFGSPCSYEDRCQPGLMCHPQAVSTPRCAGGVLCCTEFCDVTLPNMCPGEGQQCILHFTPGFGEPPGYETVGVCR